MPEDVCPICEGTGFKIVERAGLTGAVRCECAVNARLEQVRSNAGIPPKFDRAALENFVVPQDNPIAKTTLGQAERDVRQFVRVFNDANPPGLLLVGGPGCGKTHLAVGVLKALITRGHEGLFFDYQNLLERIRASFNVTAGASDKEAYRSALEAEILLLDDLGSQEKLSEWVQDTITSIITHRYNNRKPLIATTNLDPGNPIAYKTPGGTEVHKKSLGEVIGPRATSRLFEMCKIIRLEGVEDYRQRHAR